MSSKKAKRSNTGAFFIIGVMFLVMGIIADRGFLAIGVTFLIIGLASMGRSRMRFIDEMEERLRQEENGSPSNEDR